MTTRDLRADLLAWISEREKECEAATPGPWHRDYAVGHPGYSDGTHDYQVWNVAGLCVADVGARDALHENGNADFIASARTALPLALKALRGEVAQHISQPEKLGRDALNVCYECGSPWPCDATRRLHAALIGGE